MPLLRTMLLVALFAVLTPLLAPSPTHAADEKLVLAFYYAWYDENSWTADKVPDFPTPRYLSRDRATIERHVSQARGAGIDALVQAWFGPANPTEDNLITLLDVAQSSGLRVSVDFEVNSPYYANRTQMVAGLRHLISTHAAHPAFLRYQGKPVIFFWRNQNYTIADWRAIRAEVDPNRTTFWVGEGIDESYLAEFDGHHLYSVAWSADPVTQLNKFGNRVRAAEQRWGDKLWVATAMPGYDDTRLPRADAFRRDRANGNYYRETFRGAATSQADWVIITSFNEWGEGTYIEPSEAYGDSYLTLTGELIRAWKSTPAAPPPANPPVGTNANPPSAPNTAADWNIPGGRFYTQTANGQGGYSVIDDNQARFWAEFNRLGGLQTVGYPISQRFSYDGFVTQAFQKLILQWRPESGTAVPVNIFDELSRRGLDQPLSDTRQTPFPLQNYEAPGTPWAQVVTGRQALLNTNSAIRSRYFSVGDPVTIFGLPTSQVEDRGNHYALRTQRAVFQQWKETVPWAQAGQVTIANGGMIAQELGWLPASATTPEPMRR